METKTNLDELLDSYKFRCVARGKDGLPFFTKEHGPEVIVKIYKSGETRPLCIYLETNCKVPRCNPAKERVKTEYELYNCHYCSK